MTWAKLDDSFPEHPKVLSVGLAARWLHVTGICYCARNLTDGEIPRAMLPMLGGSPKLAAELVSAGLWDTTTRGGWVIHDFLDYNPSRVEVEAERERKRLAGQAGGQASAKARAKAAAKARGQPPATPSATGSSGTPDPYPLASTEDKGGARGARTRHRSIEAADIARWQAERPDLEIPAFVNDYLNWKDSAKHVDKVQGFENQMRIEWKCRQFAKANGAVAKPQRFVEEGIFASTD